MSVVGAGVRKLDVRSRERGEVLMDANGLSEVTGKQEVAVAGEEVRRLTRQGPLTDRISYGCKLLGCLED